MLLYEDITLFYELYHLMCKTTHFYGWGLMTSYNLHKITLLFIDGFYLCSICFSNLMKALVYLWILCRLLELLFFWIPKKVTKILKPEDICCFVRLLGVLSPSHTWSFRVNVSLWDQFNFKTSFSLSWRDGDAKVPIGLVRNSFKKAKMLQSTDYKGMSRCRLWILSF